jgi:hypothetical protein
LIERARTPGAEPDVRAFDSCPTLPAQIFFDSHELLISNYPVEPGEEIRRLTLRSFEARVYRLQ